MILVDTSVFVDFFRSGDAALERALETGQVITHPFVIGEIALGHLKRRGEILNLLSALPKSVAASDDEVMALIERDRLYGRGVGYVDVHLLASARLSDGKLWTRDRKLQTVAVEMALALNEA